MATIEAEIQALKKKHNAEILCHFYEDGDIQLSDLVAETNSKVWGKGLRERPLREFAGST